jgi:hypothetical protein
MAKMQRQIDFIGPSVLDLGLVANSGITNKGNSKNSIDEIEKGETAPSAKEDKNDNMGITVNSNSTFTNAEGANVNSGNTIKSIPTFANTVDSTTNVSNTNIGNAHISNANKGNTKKGYNTVQFKLIRDYLNAALGDNERVEIKLSIMGQELGINPKTLYKHLKKLRETEFYITKLQYSTEIRRR